MYRVIALLFAALLVIPVARCDSDQQTYDLWRRVVAIRLFLSWQIYEANHRQPNLDRAGPVEREMFEVIGLSDGTTASWLNASAQLSIEEVARVARTLGVQPWWLMGLDQLKLAYNSDQLQSLIRTGAYPDFVPFVTLAHMNDLPWRPKEHIYEPLGCELLLETDVAKTLEPESQMLIERLKRELGRG